MQIEATDRLSSPSVRCRQRYRPRMQGRRLPDCAAGEAERLLSPLGNRWMHTQAVAAVAHRLAASDGAIDGPVLIAGAYLHDVGYAPALHETGHHGIDGARYLAAMASADSAVWSPTTRAPGTKRS